MEKTTTRKTGPEKDDLLKRLEKTVEAVLQEPAATIRSRTLWEQRRIVEKRHKAPLSMASYFPFIGRGNVLRNRLVSHEEVENMLDAALKD